MTSRAEPSPPSDLLVAGTYFVVLSASGAWVPYLAPWLAAEGFDAWAVGTISAAMAAVRLVSGPLWGILADATQRSARLLGFASALGALGAILALTSAAPAWVVTGLLLGALARAPVGSLLDSVVVRVLELRSDPARYGALRLWGSVGFLVAGGIAAFLAEISPILPLWLTVGLLLGGSVASRRLPDVRPLRSDTPFLKALAVLVRSPRILAVWASATLHGIALSSYDSFYAVRIAELALPARWVGASLVVGVAAEIAVFAVARPWVNRLDPLAWMGIGSGVAAVRWALTGTFTDPICLTLLATLHGITFGAWWIGAVEVLRRDLRPETRSSAQALLAAMAYGLGPMFCGLLMARVGSASALYAWSALFAALAALLAAIAGRLRVA